MEINKIFKIYRDEQKQFDPIKLPGNFFIKCRESWIKDNNNNIFHLCRKIHQLRLKKIFDIAFVNAIANTQLFDLSNLDSLEKNFFEEIFNDLKKVNIKERMSIKLKEKESFPNTTINNNHGENKNDR